jgi:hypothetical protein
MCGGVYCRSCPNLSSGRKSERGNGSRGQAGGSGEKAVMVEKTAGGVATPVVEALKKSCRARATRRNFDALRYSRPPTSDVDSVWRRRSVRRRVRGSEK